MKYTTLNKIREQGPCIDGWIKLLDSLGKTSADDEPLAFTTILDSNGLDDALWCLRSAPEYDTEWRLFAVWCARQVQHLMTDQRSLNALDVSERYAYGWATAAELAAAWTAAWTAAEAAADATSRAVSEAAAWAASRAVSGAAAWTAARAAAWAASRAVSEAVSEEAAAEAAAWEAQEIELRRVFES
jgi:hypothetical protein